MLDQCLCTNCSHRNKCGVSSGYVKVCANYKFLKCMSVDSLCPTCKYQDLCLNDPSDEVVTKCSQYKKTSDERSRSNG